MTPDEWMRELRALHQAARAGKLDDAQKKIYTEACEQLARSMVAAQRLNVDPGLPARRVFHVTQGLQVDLDLLGGRQRCMTQDLSCGGFAVTLKEAPGPKELPGYTLRLPGGAEPLVGRVKVAAVVARPGSARVSFAFENMSEKQTATLESALFDIVLSRVP